MKVTKTFLLGLSLVVAAGATAPAIAEDTVKVGVLMSISGPAAPIGIPERDIIRLLADKINADGGVKGHKLELVFHDDQSNPTEAARGATKLIRQDQVKVILGPSTGSSALAAAPIAARSDTPLFSPVSTQSFADKKQTFFPWVFRSVPASATTMQAMMQKYVFDGKIKKVAIMHQEDAYGKDEADLAEKLIKEHGGIDIVAVASAPLSATDLTAAATRIRNSDPDLILLLTSAPAMGGAFARAAQQADIKSPILGSLSLNQKPFVTAAGTAGNGILSVSLGNWDAPSKRQAELGKLLTEAGKEPAGYAELIGSTALLAFVEALKKVDGPITGKSIRDAAETICGFKGTYLDGSICYSPDQHDGPGVEVVNVVQLKDGKWYTIK